MNIVWTPELAAIVVLIVVIGWWLLFRKAIVFSCWKLVSWIRSLPGFWRYMTDAAYRRRCDLVVVYDHAVLQMLANRAIVRRKDLTDGSHPSVEAVAAEEFAESKKMLAAVFSAMDEEMLEAVSAYAHEDLLRQTVPLADVLDFYRSEKTILATSPLMSVGHLERFIQRFGHCGK